MLLSLISAPAAHAVGFGDARVISALNEPLRADIPLLDSQGLEAEQIQVRLADARTLQQMGLEEQSIPDDLELNLQLADGEPRVVVRSRGPVTEPYVTLVLDLRMPEGQLLKEFTLLLDPPRTSTRAIGFSSATDNGVDPSSGTPAGTIGGASTEANAAAREPDRSVASDAADGLYRMGDAPETLWRIASRHLPARGITTQQTMLAILRLNPAAFIDGNINRLKALQTLRLPTAEEAAVLSAAEAFETVQAQVAAWNGQSAAPSAEEESDSPQAVPEVARAPVAAEPEPPAYATAADSAATDSTSSDSSGAAETVAADDASATAEPSEGRLNIVADPVALQADNDRLLAEAEQLRSELTSAREEAATALEARDREIDTLRTQVERLKVAARAPDTRDRSGNAAASDSLMGSAAFESVIMVLVGMGLAGGYFWWRGRDGRRELSSERTSRTPEAGDMRPAEPPRALENPAVGQSVPPPPWVQPLAAPAPDIAETKPAASSLVRRDAAPTPPIHDVAPSALSAADFRLEADDVDALDPDTLALEMDIPGPAGVAAPAPAAEALPALEGAEFDFLDDLDSTATKLDLARAYREMGDSEGAREILKEVMEEGNAEQQQAARELLATL